jgi:galactokinase
MPGALEMFRETFGAEPHGVVRAPGRVNLIGEHTDYNDGFVLPLAIDLELRLAFRRRDDAALKVYSRELPATDGSWRRYVEGVRKLANESLGFDGVVASDIPLGAGLSSSAALELAVARALAAANGDTWHPLAAARLCQRAEIEYAGNRCGIMDQLAVAFGKAGHALFIDCRSLEVRLEPLPAHIAVVVCDSARPRQLVDSAYNERRAACEEAARRMGVAALRDATPDMLSVLPRPLAKRAEHVVAENQRVLDFVAALEASDTQRLGRLMDSSHASLRDLYEVSCAELDLLVELASGLPGCIGSRLTGAGFGGCTVSLVEAPAAGEFASVLLAHYRERTKLPGRVWICRPSDGVSLVP